MRVVFTSKATQLSMSEFNDRMDVLAANRDFEGAKEYHIVTPDQTVNFNELYGGEDQSMRDPETGALFYHIKRSNQSFNVGDSIHWTVLMADLSNFFMGSPRIYVNARPERFRGLPLCDLLMYRTTTHPFPLQKVHVLLRDFTNIASDRTNVDFQDYLYDQHGNHDLYALYEDLWENLIYAADQGGTFYLPVAY